MVQDVAEVPDWSSVSEARFSTRVAIQVVVAEYVVSVEDDVVGRLHC